ncbi:cation/H(+) antiporter [Spongiactinospora rosea]|uniref:Cation/H(+) antiporter n=1 Tax=Spongiactinospora rosea TaxID=2248750 RepID=A0A366M248_9ACTN|nr:cation:proton antiporter [Spongiactinospora rosea]RBQ20097.1 cation/H(+) antiporter [Spongiactinospora rosea]
MTTQHLGTTTATVLDTTAEPGGGLARFLLAVAVILAVCHLCGALMRRWGQPAVLGEIMGGLLLGPSALGLVWPEVGQWLFTETVKSNLDVAAQLGLIVFMLMLGCELRTGMIGNGRMVGAAVLGGMGLPFLAGAGLGLVALPMLIGRGAGQAEFVAFFGLAIAITALPVLARILVDLGLDRTPIGALALSAAALGDGIAWLALTLILAGTGTVAMTGVFALALVAAAILLVRPVLTVLSQRIGSDHVLLVVPVVGAITFSACTQMINLHPVIGAFLFGVVVPRDSPMVERVTRQLHTFTIAVLLPLFFAGVGLNTSVGLLGASPVSWLLFAGVLAVAVVTKIVGTGGAARLAGLPGRQALSLGILMNCRGVTELVVASIGLRAGLINGLGFTILVLVAVVTTAATGPLMRRRVRDETHHADREARPDGIAERDLEQADLTGRTEGGRP